MTHHKLYIQTVEAARTAQPARPKPAEGPISLQARAVERARQQMQEPVQSWNVAQVSDWVAALGLPQYRKRFIHQGISGPLLLKLNHKLLKVSEPDGALSMLA